MSKRHSSMTRKPFTIKVPPTTAYSFTTVTLLPSLQPATFHRLVGLTAQLRGDSKAFRTERARGEVASSVSCYMKDNPGCKEEDALKYIDAVLDDLFKGLNWELFKPDNINNDSMWNIKKHAFNIARGMM
eukprot:Gb_15782 [translate_table: standard]